MLHVCVKGRVREGEREGGRERERERERERMILLFTAVVWTDIACVVQIC